MIQEPKNRLPFRHRLSVAAMVACCAACSQGANGGPAMASSANSALLGGGGAASTAPAPTQSVSVQKYTYKVGPYSLPAHTSAEAMVEAPGEISFALDNSIWLTGFTPSVEDGKGKALPTSLIHFAVVSNGSETNPLCDSKQTSKPFAATTSAVRDIKFPAGMGYPIIAGDPLSARVVLQNPTNEDYQNVYFSFTLTGESMDEAGNKVDVDPMLLDVDPCDHKPLTVEPNSFVEKKRSFSVPENGSITQAYGLLQNYGVAVELNANERSFWRGVPTINEEYQIVDLPPYDDPKGVEVKTGETLTIEVQYDNPSNVWHNGATGAAMVYMARE